jgi:hypothetical protein
MTSGPTLQGRPAPVRMVSAVPGIGGSIVLAFASLLALAPAIAWSQSAVVCGDADGDDAITDTDGVRALRGAADLGPCPLRVCDVNLDGALTDVDAVRTLRRAAALPAEVSCLAEQADRHLGRVLRIGVARIPGAEVARVAETPCPDGGTTVEDATGFEDSDCRFGDLVSNGRVTFTSGPAGATIATFESFSVRDLSSGEELRSAGSLTFTPVDENFRVSGTAMRTSNQVGQYRDTYADTLAAGDDSGFLEGEVSTTVTAGMGPFLNVTSLLTTVVGPGLVVVEVTFAGGRTGTQIVAEPSVGVCAACTTNGDCNPLLACFPCAADCTGVPQRCSLVEFSVECQDGTF